LDGVGVEFVQLQQPDAAVVEQQASGAVAQTEVVDELGALLGPSRALKTQSILGSMGWFMVGV
jgi:hypothetical protein